MMKKVITESEISALWNAREEVRGTMDYRKFDMETSAKYPIPGKDKLSSWKFVGWGIPTLNHDYDVKRYKDKIYIVAQIPDITGCIERFVLNKATNDLLHVTDENVED